MDVTREELPDVHTHLIAPGRVLSHRPDGLWLLYQVALPPENTVDGGDGAAPRVIRVRIIRVIRVRVRVIRVRVIRVRVRIRTRVRVRVRVIRVRATVHIAVHITYHGASRMRIAGTTAPA